VVAWCCCVEATTLFLARSFKARLTSSFFPLPLFTVKEKRIGEAQLWAHGDQHGGAQSLLLYLFFARSEIRIVSPTARRPQASTSTSASTSPASSSSTTVCHGEMDGALGDARLRHPPRRFVRAWIFAGSSLPQPIRTPPPTSPILISPRA
jgi:hypothetical protein